MLDGQPDEQMQSPLTMEQNELRTMLRSFLDGRAPLEGRQDDEVFPWRKVWAELAALGLTGLLIDEEAGGSGATLVEAGILFEELGWSVASLPALMTAVAVALALPARHASPHGMDLLRSIADGQISVALCRSEGGEFVAECRDDGFVISGRSRVALDMGSADQLVVVAENDHKLRLFAVDGNRPDVQRHVLPSIDPTRARGLATFDSARAQLLTSEGWPSESVAAADRACEAALASELVGVGRRALAMAVGYAQERSQFGRPIGANQAIKHLCADVYVELQAAVAGARLACRIATFDEEAIGLTSGSLVAAAEAAVLAAETNIQIHGGIGFAWEHSAHHLLKRAKAGSMIVGSIADHRSRVAVTLGM